MIFYLCSYSDFFPEFDKHLKKAGGHIGRNVAEITIKMKTIVRKPLMIIIIKFHLRNLDNKHLKKAGGHIGRNVGEITIKIKTIIRKPSMIKITTNLLAHKYCYCFYTVTWFQIVVTNNNCSIQFYFCLQTVKWLQVLLINTFSISTLFILLPTVKSSKYCLVI